MNKRILNQTGDTIVEVLIATAVVGLMIVGAYVTSNNSLIATERAQERGEAVKIAESQAEMLSSMAQLKSSDTGYINIFDNTPGHMVFCLAGNTYPFQQTYLTDEPKSLLVNDSYNEYSAPKNCTFDSSDNSGPSNRYNTAVIYDDGTKTFNIQIRWYRYGGGQDELSYLYRVK